MALKIPEKCPEPGFYRHYKHDPAKGARDYTYFIFSVGFHTEDDCEARDRVMLGYRPLYDSADFPPGPYHFNRPLEMFYEPATKDGQSVERFTRVTDTAQIEALKAAYREMYPAPF